MPKGRNKDSRRRKRLDRELERERGVVNQGDWLWDDPRNSEEDWDEEDIDWDEEEEDWDDPSVWYVYSEQAELKSILN